MKYKDWLDIWLTHYIKPTCKIRTYERYRKITEIHILPLLGEIEIEDITAVRLQQVVSTMLESGNKRTNGKLSANTVKSIISVLQNSLRTAKNMGYINEYVADKIHRPKATEKRVECFTPAEQKKIEQAVSESCKTKLRGIVICLYTGLRIGELLALRWEDIDLAKGKLTVNHTCHDANANGRHVRLLDSPKTENSARQIPLSKPLLVMLKEMKKTSKCEYIIADGTKSVFVRSYQRTFELLLKRLKIPHKGFHSLRHTFATRALECGIDVKSLSEILGHKNATITLNRYAHSLWEHKAEMMNKLSKNL